MNILLVICIYLFFTFFNYCIAEIKIPFESKLCINNENSEDLLSNYYNQFLYTPIKIGSENQKLEVSLKLNRYITYLISSKNTNLKSDYFNEKNSKTYKEIEDEKIQSSDDEFFTSIKSSDNFIFGENINFNQYLFYLSQEQKFDETGHIGLQMQPHRLDTSFSGNSFIHQLKGKSLINSYNFYFKYEYKDENEFKYEGNLIIGGMPHEIEPSEIFKEDNFVQDYAEITQYLSRWRLKISSVSYGDNVLSKLDTAELSTTFGFIEAPINFLSIFDVFFNKNKCYGDYNGKNKTYFFLYCEDNVDISTFKDLIFQTSNKEMNFTLTYKDLFRKIGKKIYFLLLFNEDINEWKFGHIFLKKYTMVFNGEKKTIGYYYQPNNNNEKNSSNNSKIYIFVIISVIFGLIIIGLLIYIFYFKPYKSRKVRPNELEENFDYTSHEEEKNQKNKLGV